MNRETSAIIAELQTQAQQTCDHDLEGALRAAMVLLRASLCREPGCDRRPEVGAYCRPCYQRKRRHA